MNELQAGSGVTRVPPFKDDGRGVDFVGVTSTSSICGAILSSTTGRTLFNFDPDFLEGGCDSLRLIVEAGGDVGRGGVEEVGGVVLGNGTSAHCETASVVWKYSPLLGDQAFLVITLSSGFVVSGGEAFMGLGEGEAALALIESGCKMLKIWSSACGGPYESNGSGMD